jgi:hypothetical protein
MAPKKATKSIDATEFDSEPETVLIPKNKKTLPTGSPAVVPEEERIVDDDESPVNTIDIIANLSDHGFRVEGEFKDGSYTFQFSNGSETVNPRVDGNETRRRTKRQPGTMRTMMSILGADKPPSYHRAGLKQIGY